MNLKLVTAFTLVLTSAAAGGKAKPVLPEYVRLAHTVAVLVNPDAGVSLDDPRANQVAQKDVETALSNWGRYTTVIGSQNADLLIVVRKGSKHLVDQTISDPRGNGRTGVINPGQDGIGIGAQHGTQPPLSGGSRSGQAGTGDAHPVTQVGSTVDSFAVYDGQAEHPLDAPPAWRFLAKDGLKPHTVPAVDEFRKAVAEADKAAAARKTLTEPSRPSSQGYRPKNILIPATPAAPTCTQSLAFVSVTPPSANTGTSPAAAHASCKARSPTP